MDTSRSIFSQSDRLNRYTHRIQQLLGRSKSKSKSPYRCHTPKVTKQGPMVSRIDTYIKYQHSFFVLNKIMQFKAKQLMSDFMILMKYPSKRESKLKPSTKFVVIKEPAVRVRSNVLVYRVSNIVKGQVKKGLEAIRERANQRQIAQVNKQIGMKEKVNVYNKNVSILVMTLNMIMGKALKSKKMNGLTAMLRVRKAKEPMAYPLVKVLQKLAIRNKRLGWREIMEMVRYRNAQTQMLRELADKLIQTIKHKLSRIGQAYSVIQSRKPQEKDIQYINNLEYLHLNYVSLIVNKALKFKLVSAFEKLVQNSSRKQYQQEQNRRLSLQVLSIKKVKKDTFSRMSKVFSRLIEMFQAKQLKVYDETFQVLFENRFDAEQFYFNNHVLNKLILSRAFQQLNLNAIGFKREARVGEGLAKLIQIVSSKMKIIRCSTFWSMHSNSLQIGYEEMEPPAHKCSHGLAYTLNRVLRSRQVEGYLSIKRASNQYSQIKPIADDTSSIFIYDDMASFLEQRHGAFQQLKTNYDRLKAMVGYEGESQITSTSFQSIRAINQIKSKLNGKSIE